MREFLAPRRSNSGLVAQSPFQHLPKDEDLSAIMARRRQIADSGEAGDNAKSNSNKETTTPSEFHPKSNRMTTVLNSNPSLDHKRSDHSRNSKSEHSRTSVSSDFRPRSNRMAAALEKKGSDHSRNEASSELLTAMSKRRTKVEDTSIAIVSPRQKIRHQNYKHVPMSPMLQEKLDKRKLMVENIDPLPLPKAERKNAKRNNPSKSNEEQSMMSSITSMTSSSVRHASFPSKIHNENDESSSESSVSHKFHSDAENRYSANGGKVYLDDGYQSTSDESGAQLANIIMAHHRRSPRRNPKSNTASSFDESGETFADESKASSNFPVVSDDEADHDPFETSMVQDGSFYGKSTSGSASESDVYDDEEVEAATDDEEIVDPEYDESDDDMMSNDNTYEEHTVDEEFLVEEEKEDEQTVDDEEFLVDEESEEEQTVDDEEFLDDEEVGEEQTVYDDQLNLFPNVLCEGFGQPQQFDEIVDEGLDLEQEHSINQNSENRSVKSNNPFIAGNQGSCSPSSRASSTDTENKIRGSINAEVFGGKIVDGRVDRDVPLGDGDDSSYDFDAKTGLARDSKVKKYNKNRVCSWTMVIALVLIGSIVIGVGIGVFFSKKSGDGNGNSDAVDDPNEPKPEVADTNAVQVPPEQAATYSVICPKVIDCAGLLDKKSAQGRAFDWIVNKTANPQVAEMEHDSIVRRYALAAIYYSTEGDSWVDNTNWLSNQTECNWFSSSESGSGCGIEGQTLFSSLELDNNNVTGILPFEVSLLSTLSKISIRNPVGTDPYLRGTLPSELGKLTAITSLSLSGNQFSGGIPMELGDCVNLETLDLSENGLNGELPTSLSSLANLTSLNLEGNFFSGRVDPLIFEGINGLLELNLKRNRLTGIPETIIKLKQLQKLNLASNNLSTVPLAITLFSELTHLDLSTNGFTGSIPVQFGTMSSLSHLDLSDNKFSGMIPVELGNLVNLETILDLSSNELSGPIPSRFGQLVELLRLRLDKNRLSGTIPSDLGALSKIEEIRFDSNDLTGPVPTEICTLYTKERPASYADCNELQNATCITNCCTMDGGCVCQFEKTEPLLCIKGPI